MSNIQQHIKQHDATYNISIQPPTSLSGNVEIPTSKSIANRSIVIDALSNNTSTFQGAANCDDVAVMLNGIKGETCELDIMASGTAMRFLTAYWSIQPNSTHILTGTERMKQRPIKVLVDSLRTLGADIEYMEKEGYPPLKINGKSLEGGMITMPADVSSQYVSALLMIAPLFTKGLTLTLKGTIASRSYIDLTIDIMTKYGAKVHWTDVDTIKVEPKRYEATQRMIENDWTSASYWYLHLALSDCQEAQITMQGLSESSKQGDSVVRYLFSLLGIKTTFIKETTNNNTTKMVLSKDKMKVSMLHYDFINAPDLAQTMVVACVAMGISFRFTGLSTLKIKETNRIAALQSELLKLGFVVNNDKSDELSWNGERCAVTSTDINTFEDHRMALAFSALTYLFPNITINAANVVSKSYPHFWSELEALGYLLNVKS